jgi:multiple sugar transport system permease protein
LTTLSATARRPTEPADRTTEVRHRRSPTRDSGWWAAVMLVPAVLGLGVFEIWPTFETIYYSFTSWGAFGGHDWSGLANYAELLEDRDVGLAFVNTALLTAISLLGVPLALVTAALLSQPGLRGVTVYRTVYFLPVVTLPAAVALTWKFLYNGDYGLVNYLLSLVGIDGPYWLSDPRTVIVAVGAVAVWGSIGYNMVILLAGIQGIPRDYYEAADLDGAGRLRQFRHITLPLLTPTIFFVVVISVINALQTFDLVFLMVGPTNPAIARAQTLVYLFYENGFDQHDGGYAAAIAVLLLISTLVLTAIQFRLQKRWVHYG